MAYIIDVDLPHLAKYCMSSFYTVKLLFLPFTLYFLEWKAKKRRITGVGDWSKLHPNEGKLKHNLRCIAEIPKES